MERNIYDGVPSIKLRTRPTLTIICGCYNSRKDRLDRLLRSINSQGINNDMEMILIDDCSKDTSYQEVIDKYRSKMSIRQYKTEENSWHGPGASRQIGLENAFGKFLMICDHDDEYIENALTTLVNYLKGDGKNDYYISTNFYMVAEDGTRLRDHSGLNSWNHGKVYSIDRLIRPYHIHFYEGLASHEDICISSQVNCAMSHMRRDPTELNLYTYLWYHNEDSASNRKMPITFEGQVYEVPYIFTWFDDYLRSTLDVYIDFDSRGLADPQRMYYSSMQILAYSYFYLESMLFEFPYNMCADNYNHVRDAYQKFKNHFKNFDTSPTAIYNWLADNGARNFEIVQINTKIATNDFVPQESLMQYLINITKPHQDTCEIMYFV